MTIRRCTEFVDQSEAYTLALERFWAADLCHLSCRRGGVDWMRASSVLLNKAKLASALAARNRSAHSFVDNKC